MNFYAQKATNTIGYESISMKHAESIILTISYNTFPPDRIFCAIGAKKSKCIHLLHKRMFDHKDCITKKTAIASVLWIS